MSDLAPNPQESCAFLDLLYPGLRRVLVSINPLAERGREEISAATFEPGDHAGVERYVVDAASKGWNVYYSVNQTIGPMRKKPARPDIAAIHYLHVDVDPRKASPDEQEDMPAFLARERERIIKLLEAPPDTIPQPTAIVESGGGYNALWRLDKPLHIVGQNDKERIVSADSFKHYNRQLERKFGGDNCHNIDRILRLPGSLNFPNHVKIKHGRTQVTLARLRFWDGSRVYSINDFTTAPLTREQTSGAPPRIAAPTGPLKRVKSLDDLDLSKLNNPHIENLLRRVIAEGRDSQNADRFVHEGKFDRSRAVFFVTTNLKKAGIERDQIYAIMSDPKFGISESLLEKGASMERNLLRAIERGEWAAESEELAELNERHAVIASLGGKCVVVQEEKVGSVQRSRLTVSSFDDVKARYSNRFVQVGAKKKKGSEVEEPQMVKLGQWWLDHPQRRQFDHIVFEPGRETPGSYNLWQGFAVEAVEGDCSLFLTHIRDVVCGGNLEYYDYLINWMACAVQKPDEPGHVAIVFRGEPGAGKGIVAREFGKLFGRHYLQITNSNHLVGQFNDHLRDCVLLLLDEAFFAGDVKHKSILKALVTEPEIMIEKKGVDALLARNHLHIMMASNEKWVVPAEAKERRYFVLDVPSSKRGMAHESYWTSLVKQMENGGREALLFMLKNRNIESFQPRNYPETKALAEQKMLSLNSLQEWWYQKLQGGQVHSAQVKWTAPVIADRFLTDYLNYAGKLRQRIAAGTELGRFLTKMVPGLRKVRKTFDDNDPRLGIVKRRYNAYEFPPLAECREAWDAEFGKSEWDPEEPESDAVDPVPSDFVGSDGMRGP